MRRLDGWAGRRVVNRREFLETSAAFAAALPFAGAASRLPDYPPTRLGIQLYTLRNLLEKDFEGTIAKIARIGYKEVEFAGVYGRKAVDLKRALDQNHLVAPAGHCDIEAVTVKLDDTIAQAKTLGHKYVVVAWIPDEARTVDGYANVADTFNQAGEKLNKAGLALGYHNHSFEFDKLDGDRCGYDILLERTQPELLHMELDLYWIREAGRDAFRYFTQNQGRFRMVHIKDMSAEKTMVDVGQGVMDWPSLLSAAKAAGVEHYFVEHDEAKDPIAFAKTSYEYLHRLKFK